MGVGSSKLTVVGNLKGAYVATKHNATLGLAGPKETTVVVPKGKKTGDTMTVELEGQEFSDVQIPTSPDGDKLKMGDVFQYKYIKGDIHRVIASTLPSSVGVKIVEQKQMIYANVAYSFIRVKWNDQKEQIGMAKKIPMLIQQAQEELLGKAIDEGCNAVFGITSNVTTDSSGSDGNSKLVIVTLVGTPCVVVSESTGEPPELVAMDANVVI